MQSSVVSCQVWIWLSYTSASWQEVIYITSQGFYRWIDEGGAITDLYCGMRILHSQCWPLLTIEQLPKVLLLMQFCSVAQYDIFAKLHKRAACGIKVWSIEASSWLGANNRDPPWRLASRGSQVSKVKFKTCSWVYIAVKLIIGVHGGEDREKVEAEIWRRLSTIF